MQPSRRRMLKLVGVSALPLIGGCSSLGSSADATPTQTDEPPVVARLVGPDTDRALFRRSSVESVGSVHGRDGAFGVPVTLSDEAVADVVARFDSAGVTKNRTEFSVVLSEGDRDVTRFGVSPGLVEAVGGGDWQGEFRLQFDQRATAESVRQHLG